ncbi:3011_t:CDS:2 [Dentiscutata heterogama]|uniref:3011_t:CDS:1 n=1 Tax=Dentiscutata heterogama TaxID=1316150 RepID=A0ACA9K3V8_9GLOM|nr:3011_t:CDS:2 [Dentiscutata heterogama]
MERFNGNQDQQLGNGMKINYRINQFSDLVVPTNLPTTIKSGCDCDPENIKNCDPRQVSVGGSVCGRAINCDRVIDLFQVDVNGDFCHLNVCNRDCVCQDECHCGTGQ